MIEYTVPKQAVKLINVKYRKVDWGKFVKTLKSSI